MIRYDAVHDGQTKAGALFTRGHVRLEQPVTHFGGKARPIVFNHDLQPT